MRSVQFRMLKCVLMRGSFTSMLLLLAGGCAVQQPEPKSLATNIPVAVAPAPVTPPRATQPVAVEPFVLHLPGVSGTSIVDYSLRDGLRAGGLEGPMEIYDWTCHDPGIPALHARARNEDQAKIVAEMITKQYRARPERPIYLTSHSGGAGPATWALEKLPPDVKVARYVMLAPALSPTYDLSKAMAHVSASVYCFFSKDDDLVLGTGTKLFGTIDGVRCEAAGRIGFEKPADAADATQYDKLIQRPYEAGWTRYGHIGGHVGCMSTPFVRAIVAPILLGKPASPEVLNTVVPQQLPDVLWPK
jgi:hypothetical protein